MNKGKISVTTQLEDTKALADAEAKDRAALLTTIACEAMALPKVCSWQAMLQRHRRFLARTKPCSATDCSGGGCTIARMLDSVPKHTMTVYLHIAHTVYSTDRHDGSLMTVYLQVEAGSPNESL